MEYLIIVLLILVLVELASLFFIVQLLFDLDDKLFSAKHSIYNLEQAIRKLKEEKK